MPATTKSFHFVLAVWGDSYIDTLLDIALPSFLAPGNLPACARDHHVEFHIYTTPQDEARIAAHPAWLELATHCRCLIHPVLTEEQFKRQNRYAVMSYCHQIAIRTARRAGAVLSLLGPDCIIADGGLGFGVRLIDRGFKAVMVTGPRGEMEPIAPVVTTQWRLSGSAAISIPNRELMQLLIDHPHPISQRLFWDAEQFTAIPSAIYFHVGPGGILAKHFHLHPLFIDLSDAPESAEDNAGTVDGPLLRLAGIDNQATYVVTNSDDIAIIEISRKVHDWMGGSETLSPTWRTANWMLESAEPDHRRNFLDYNMRFIGTRGADWRLAGPRALKPIAALEKIIHWSLRAPRCYEAAVKSARQGIRFYVRCRRQNLSDFSRAKIITLITSYQSALAPRIARHAGWLYWPLAAFCRTANIRFLINMPAGMGHNTSELDSYLRQREIGAIGKDERIVLFRDPNRIHRDSVGLYRSHFWWAPTSRFLYCALLPMVMRFRDLTIDGGMSRLKWQLREDLSYSPPVAGQTYLYQVSKEAGLENWKSYFALRARTPDLRPLADGVGLDSDLLQFLGGSVGKLALFHIKSSLSNATGAPTAAADYLPVMTYLREQGYRSVFVGREKMPEEFAAFGVLNYAESPVASYRHDVQLFKAAAVAVTGGSGIAYLPDCLNIPYVYANSWHIGMPMCSRYCVIVPSLAQERSTGRILGLREQADLYWSMPDDGHESFPQERYLAVNATAKEICEAVKEALILKEAMPPQNALQQAYLKVDDRGLLSVTKARVGAFFIEQHRDLLPDVAEPQSVGRIP